MANPERDVIADIDALEAEWAAQDEVIDYGLRANRGFDDYHRDWHDRSGDVRCVLCHGEWHGLQSGTCPGEYATESEKEVYRATHRTSTATTIDMASRSRHHRFRRELQSEITTGTLGVDGQPATWTGAEVQEGEVHRGSVITLASPQMQAALVEHVTRYPEDEDALMRRFRDLIFTPDGRPVPWTPGGLRTVLGGDEHRVRWAQRQLGVVDLGAESGE